MVAVFERGGAPTQAEFHEAISNRSDRWFSACLKITRSPELAEDAVQEALLSAWSKRDQFQRGARLETWIHRIAVNAALQIVRRNRPGVYESLDADVPDTATGPAEALQNTVVIDKLSAMLGHLSENERICFVLKHMEQWRLREIADELGTSESAVKQTLFRAVKKMRGKMTDLRRACP